MKSSSEYIADKAGKATIQKTLNQMSEIERWEREINGESNE